MKADYTIARKHLMKSDPKLNLIIKRVGIGSFLFERPAWARIAESRPSTQAAPWASATLASNRP